MWNLLFLFTCLAFSLMLLIIFHSKKTLSTRDNALFSVINIITTEAVFCEIVLQSLTYLLGADHIVTYICQKFYLISVSAWFTVFSMYVFNILIDKYSKNNNNKSFKRIKVIHLLVFVILLLLFSILPIYYHFDSKSMFTFGPAVDLLKIVIGGYILLWIILSICNHKSVFRKNYIPILATYIFISLNLILQSLNPELLIVSITLTFVSYLMYFTIENPDLKMVNELYRNKNIMEQTLEDKSNFVFEVTQEVKNPILNIRNLCNESKGNKKISEYQDTINMISDYSRQLEFIINDILDVGTLDSNQIKFINNKYNIELIYNEVINKITSVLPKDVRFTPSLESNIPALYGDSIKLKQILTSLLLNSVKHTNKGFIEFNINSIRKFDAVRLIITIKDSSEGLSLDKINDILSTTGSLDEKEIEEMNQSQMNMAQCQKIVKLMGGNMLIRSANENGSTIILTLDQNIKKDNEDSILNKYELSIKTGLNVAIVCQDKSLINHIKRKITKDNVTSSFLMNGKDLIDEVKDGKKFDLIFVANEMKEISGYNILVELKKIQGFSSKVIMMLEEDNMNLKKHFLEDGFNNIIDIENAGENIAKIIKESLGN